MAQLHEASEVTVQADASICCAPVQVVQDVHGALPLALKVLPETQLPPALDTQTPPESVKPAAQPQTVLEVAVQTEKMVCCAPLQAAQAAHGHAPDALHVMPAAQALAAQLPPLSV